MVGRCLIEVSYRIFIVMCDFDFVEFVVAHFGWWSRVIGKGKKYGAIWPRLLIPLFNASGYMAIVGTVCRAAVNIHLHRIDFFLIAVHINLDFSLPLSEPLSPRRNINAFYNQNGRRRWGRIHGKLNVNSGKQHPEKHHPGPMGLCHSLSSFPGRRLGVILLFLPITLPMERGARLSSRSMVAMAGNRYRFKGDGRRF